MKNIYSKIWKLAKPYYEKGRPMDIDHIEWMMKDALLVSEKENLDDSLIIIKGCTFSFTQISPPL